MRVEDKPVTMPPAEKTMRAQQRENDFRTGFLADFRSARLVWRGRQETARFLYEPAPAAARSVADNVRWNV